MKLATIADYPKSSPDGRLVLIDADSKFVWAPELGQGNSMLDLLENWTAWESKLLSQKEAPASKLEFNSQRFLAPLPRSYAFYDGSAFLEHVRLARSARRAALPDNFEIVPLMYQGISDSHLAHIDPIVLPEDNLGPDFEAELGVIVDYVPMGTNAQNALKHIKLVVLLNDITYREVVPAEIGRGFGFLQSKPASAFAPLALTPDEFGSAWHNGRLDAVMICKLNGELIGQTLTKEMHFSFGDLIKHAARTRSLPAGTIIGSGTVSNSDPSRGSSCLVEKRMREQLAGQTINTGYLKPGDQISIEAHVKGQPIFGSINQKVIQG